MKTLVPKSTLPVLIAIVAVAIGGTYALTSASYDDISVQKSGAHLVGHLELIVTDENGFIKDYRQSDNQIVRDGMAIIASQVFGDINYTQGPVHFMDIGTDGETLPDDYDLTLSSAVGGSCARQNVTWTNETAVDAGGDLAQISVNGTATFQGSDCAANSIDEAGVFTSLVGGEMFARNTFNDVDLEASDQLTLNWDFVFTDS